MKNKKRFLKILLIAFLLFPAVSLAQLADSPWPMYMGNLKHTGLSPYATDIQYAKLKWKFDAGNGIETGATIGSDGTIYFGTYKDNFFALNPDGTIKWKFHREGEEFRSTPTVAKDGTIYFGAIYDLEKVHNILHDEAMDYGRPKVYALNPDSTVKWEFPTGGILGGTYASPTIGPDGTVYMGAGGAKMTERAEGGDRVWAISPDGTAKWHFKTDEAIFTAIAVADDGTIYVACADSNLYALTPEGKEKWRFTRDTGGFSVFDGTPTIGSDGTVYVASTNQNLYAVNPQGEEKWHFKVDDLFEATPTIGPDGTIYFGVIDQSEKDKHVYALDPNGRLKWKFETGGGIFGSPAIDRNGILFFGSYDGNLYSLNPDGIERWRFPTYAGIVVTPTIDKDGTIYVGSWDNHLYAIGAGDSSEDSLPGTRSDSFEKVDDLGQSDRLDKTAVAVVVILLLISTAVVLIILKKKNR